MDKPSHSKTFVPKVNNHFCTMLFGSQKFPQVRYKLPFGNEMLSKDNSQQKKKNTWCFIL